MIETVGAHVASPVPAAVDVAPLGDPTVTVIVLPLITIVDAENVTSAVT